MGKKTILIMVLLLISLASFVSADSTNPYDYAYSDGTSASDLGLDKLTAGVNGQYVTTTGWAVAGENEVNYSNVQKSLGTVSGFVDNNGGGDNPAAQFAFTNTTWTGLIGFKLYVKDYVGGDGSIRVGFSAGTAHYFGITEAVSTTYFSFKSSATNKTIESNKWLTFVMNFTGSNVNIFYWNETTSQFDSIANNTMDLTGVDLFRFMSVWGGGNPEPDFYFDEFKMTGAGVFSFPTGAPAPGATSNPSFVAPTPPSASHNNTAVTFNCSHISSDELNFSMYLNEVALFTNVTPNGTNYLVWNSTVSDGNYNISCQVLNQSSGAMSNLVYTYWTLDTVTPTITINPKNGFTTGNRSTIDQYNNTLPINITFTDEIDLFAVLINITFKDGTSYFNFSASSLAEMVYNYTKTVNTSNWPYGEYNIELMAADSHTKNSIADYDISKSMNSLRFKTEEKNDITISSQGSISTGYTKQKDSYDFEFNYLFGSDTRTVRIDAAGGKVYKIANEKYNAHFVVWNGNEGNWIDFEGTSKDYTIKKVSDSIYDITFNNLADTKKIKVKSIGGLNVAKQNYTWYRGVYSQTYTQTTTFGTVETFSLNITRNATFAIPYASFYYNNTFFNVTQVNTSQSIIFSSALTIPDPDILTAYIPFIWRVNITQPSAATYNFNVTGNQTVTTFFIENCSSEGINSLNFTIINATSNANQDGYMEFLFKYSYNGTAKNYSTSTTGNNISFCIYPNSTTFVSDIDVSYNKDTDYYTYYATGLTMTNVSQNINLYLSDGATRVTFTVTDLYDNPVSGAFVRILKYDLSSNSYITTEILQTNADGQAQGNIILYTTSYTFMVVYNGITYLTDGPYKVFETTRVFRIDLGGSDWYGDYDNANAIVSNLNFSNSTKMFLFTWIDPSGAMATANLEVIKRNMSKSVVVCNNMSVSTSGVLQCYIGTDVNCQSYYAGAYVKYGTLIFPTQSYSIDFGGPNCREKFYAKSSESKIFGV
ncbi:hypothetical protein KKC13_13715, partial [bacterium]|nr:hypothetical protein [bacterium]